MADYQYSLYEQETTVIFNNEEDHADIFTMNKSWIRKLDKLCQQYPEQFQRVVMDDIHGSKTYQVPKNLITIRPPLAPRVISNERLAQMKELGKRLAEYKKATFTEQ